MYQPDWDEPYDPLAERLWAQVPELIRKDVEQHVVANLPTELVAKLRDLHARGIPIESDPAFFHFGAAWLSGTCAGSNSLTTSWEPTASVAIGTIAISGYSPRSLRCASNRWPSWCRSAHFRAPAIPV
jgi:hypothetical protein